MRNPLVAGIGGAFSLLMFTLIYAFVAANLGDPKLKATSMAVIFMSPYYWLFMVLLI